VRFREFNSMRDIRGDLRDRANLLEQEINSAGAQFEALLDQLKKKRDGQLEALKFELKAVNRVLDIEHRRVGSGTSAPKSPLPSEQAQRPQPSTVTDISKLRQAS
jgi:hypothetical protein